eukprot:Rhum_TRINITY_DN12867_c2_g1::Rhum_TRINITY_DN12867_c2_g1_i1::g.54849::m.54849
MSSAPNRRTDSAKGTRWAWGRHIGKGSFGDVFLAWEEGKEQAFAVKVVRLKSDEKLDNCKSLLKEVEVMKGAGQHKRIVHCIDALFDSRGMLCIVMEYMGGGAFGSFLRAAKSPLRPHIAAKCIRQVVEGMEYLHKRHIYHRDLKGDNILIKAVESCGTPLLKICDFGNSKMRNDKMMDSLISTLSDANGQTTALTVSGTALWMAPEMIQAAKHSNGYSPSKADIWALGIVACEILNRGKTPWPTYEHPVQALFDIGQWNGGKGGKDLPPNAPSGVDKECRDFIACCLRVKSEDRLGADKLLRHRYLRDVDPDPEPGLTSSEDSSVSSTSPRQTEERVNEHSVLFPVRSAEVLQVLCSRLTKGKNNEPAANAKAPASPNLTQTEEWTTQSCITPPDSPPQPPLDGPRVEIATTMTTTGRSAIHSTSSTTATTATSSSSATSAASTVAASPGEKAADTSFYTEYEEEGEEEYEEEEEEEEKQLYSTTFGVLMLALVTIIISLESEVVVNNLENFAVKSGISKPFIAVILLPIVGNVCEHASAIMMAYKRKMDIAINIAVGSSIQIAVLVIPALVLISWYVNGENPPFLPNGQPGALDLNFHPFCAMIMLVSVLVVNAVINTEEGQWITGLFLLLTYTMIMICYWFVPAGVEIM